MDKKQLLLSKIITNEQKGILRDFVNKYPKLISKKFGLSFTTKDAETLWKKISKLLNKTVGSTRSWEEWRKVIIDIM